MSNPTSNFNWQMPTSSDLVTDLPADFEVFGQAVDTSLADLKGGTTGQVLSKTSNTDMDFTWTTSASGGLTLLSTTTLTGSSVTISSINQTYTNLYVQITGATVSAGSGNITLKINSVTDSFWAVGVDGGSSPALATHGSNSALTIFKGTQTGTGPMVMSMEFSNYAESTYHTVTGSYTNVNAAFVAGYYGGGWSPIAGGAAITQLIIATTAGSFNAGTVRIYGVK
jgi:predicted secreted protein